MRLEVRERREVEVVLWKRRSSDVEKRRSLENSKIGNSVLMFWENFVSDLKG